MNCLSYKEKLDYLKKINKFYNYDDWVIKTMAKNKICHFDPKKIKTLDKKFINKIINLGVKTRDFLNKNKITYWLDSGSLLGAIRNGKFIPWDDDMDFGIFFKDFLNLEKIIRSLPLVEDLYYSEKDELYFKIRKRKEYSKNLPIKSDYASIGIYNSIEKKFFVDIIIYHKLGNNYRINSKWWFEKCIHFSKKDILPLKKKKFSNFFFNIPNNPFPFLNHHYWFWKHIGVIDHVHFKHLLKNADKNLFYIL